MDHLYRFVGILTVFIFYIAVGVEGVAYGAACTGTGTGDCTETANIVCDTTCKCTAASFRKSTTECATKIVLKAACTASQPTNQCADTNAECTAGNTCVCKSGYFEHKDGTCSAKILLKAACTSQPAGQCADALAECASGNTCKCKPNNFENKNGKCSARIALKASCMVAETAPDQCVAGAECKGDGKGNNKCLCKSTHYESSADCLLRIAPGATCAAHQCVTHASCNTTNPTQCQCEVGYTATPSTQPTMCSGSIKVATLSYMLAVPIFVSMMLLLR